ncbi:MAG TPA: histidine kinase N-terminal 7TM domain-containing protein [Anaerolineales bacterium]|nr:histidine kinase N-terminal 7TM domain-containing protein [Anaerolineales bacterium]
MMTLLNLYTISLIVSIAIMLGLASYAWQRTRVPGATAFGMVFFLSAGWAVCMLPDPYNNNLASRILWLQLRYTFAVCLSSFFLIMAARVTGSDRWLNRRTMAALFAVPVFMVVATWTSPYHQLFRFNYQLEFNGLFNSLTWENGPFSLIGMIYTYAVGFVGSFVILIRYKQPGRFRVHWRTVLMLLGTLTVAVPDLVFWVYPALTGWVNLSTSAMSLGGILYAIALFRGKVLELTPLAQMALFANMLDGVVVVDRENRIVEMNPQARRILSAKEDPIGKSADEIVPRWEIFRNRKATDTQPLVEVDLHNSAYELQMNVLLDRSGELVGRMLNLRNITARKQAEATQRMQSAALEAAVNAMAIVDVGGHFVWANPAFTRLTGFGVDEVVGQTPNLFKSGFVESTVYKSMWETLLSGRPWSGELTNRRKDGSVYPEEQTITPVMDEKGKVQYFISVKQDISERKALESMRDDLTHMLVHDLRNPLGQAKMALSMLQGGDEAADIRREMVEIAGLGLSRMEGLVNDILSISRMESGQVSLEYSPVDIARLFQQVVAQQALRAKFQNVTLLDKADPDLPSVQADVKLIQRVLENLIGNALKFTPDGGLIELSAKTEGDDFVLVSVRDNGAGFPPEMQAHLFEKFVTGKKGGGFGLGLAFCRLVVNEHGGQIRGENAPEGGAVFSFTLPVVM